MNKDNDVQVALDDFGFMSDADYIDLGLAVPEDDEYTPEQRIKRSTEKIICRALAQQQPVNAELLEALKRLVTDIKLDGLHKRAGYDCWVIMAEQAIARAEQKGGE